MAIKCRRSGNLRGVFFRIIKLSIALFLFSGSPVIYSYSELSQDDPSVLGKSHIILICNMSTDSSKSSNERPLDDLGQPVDDLDPNQASTDLHMDFWWTVPDGEIVTGNHLVLQGLEDSGPYICHVNVSRNGEHYMLQSSTYIDSGLYLHLKHYCLLTSLI